MSNRADVYAARSVLFLVGAIGVALLVPRFRPGEWLKAPPGRTLAPATFPKLPPTPSPATAMTTEPVPKDTMPSMADKYIVAVTPLPVTPISVPPRTRLLVEPARWSAPLYVPDGRSVGIRFSIGRMRIERDGSVVPGILYRNPPVVPVRDGVEVHPLASLDRTPRVFWFRKGVRVLRFQSLDRNRSEEVEVLWAD